MIIAVTGVLNNEGCPASQLYSYCKVSKNNEGYKAGPSAVSICSVDLTDDGKLGYGFTSADELEEVDIGPGISHSQHLSAKSYAHAYENR
jgi:hypothetical protein